MSTLTTFLYIINVIAAIWVIYEVLAVNRKLSTGMKVLWVILALLLGIIAAIIYYFVYKK